MKPSPILFTVLTAVLIVSYFVGQDRQRTRESATQRYEQSRQDEQERRKTLNECVSGADGTYFQQSIQAVSVDQCLNPDPSKCPQISHAETLEWQKRVLDEALVNKKIAVDVCIAAAARK
jgi:type II secretory pathway pseudopilin PulG